jgi:hypothetical protein
MADHFEEIGALDWVSSRQNENGNLQDRNLVDQMFTLICAEFHGVPVRLRRSAAMDAGKIAGLVTSQMAMKERSLKSIVLICGFISP